MLKDCVQLRPVIGEGTRLFFSYWQWNIVVLMLSSSSSASYSGLVDQRKRRWQKNRGKFRPVTVRDAHHRH